MKAMLKKTSALHFRLFSRLRIIGSDFVRPSISHTDTLHYLLRQNVCMTLHFTEAATFFLVFTVRRYALHGLCDRNSVRPSVRLSVTLVHCVNMVLPTIIISSPYGSPTILVSGDITFIPKFEGGHPERGH